MLHLGFFALPSSGFCFIESGLGPLCSQATLWGTAGLWLCYFWGKFDMENVRVFCIYGWEDSLEKGMAMHSSILAWRIPWTELPCRLQLMGLQRVGHSWMAKQQATNFPGGAVDKSPPASAGD